MEIAFCATEVNQLVIYIGSVKDSNEKLKRQKIQLLNVCTR